MIICSNLGRNVHNFYQLFMTLAEAQENIEHNSADMYEGSYDCAVIEEMPEGVLCGGDIPREWWYKWRGSWEKGGYKPWKKPKEYENIIGFMHRINRKNGV